MSVFGPQGPGATTDQPTGLDEVRYGDGVETFVREGARGTATVLDQAFFNRIIIALNDVVRAGGQPTNVGDATALTRAIQALVDQRLENPFMFHHLAAMPAATTGSDGDLALVSPAGTLWRKDNGVWTQVLDLIPQPLAANAWLGSHVDLAALQAAYPIATTGSLAVLLNAGAAPQIAVYDDDPAGWQIAPDLSGKADVNHIHAAATGQADGFMAAADKARLDAIPDAGELTAINAQAGAAYTITAADKGAQVRMTSGAANAVTVPDDTTLTWPVGGWVLVEQAGAGQTSIAPAAGVTVESDNGKLNVAAQHGLVGLTKVAANTWHLFGALKA